MTPARTTQPRSLDVIALLAAILLVAPFVRALWQTMQAAETAWLPANSDVLMSGSLIAAVLIGDSLRNGRPTRAFLLTLAACLAAVGTAVAVFAIGLQFEPAEAHQLDRLSAAGPLLALGCAGGARLCLKRAFPEERER